MKFRPDKTIIWHACLIPLVGLSVLLNLSPVGADPCMGSVECQSAVQVAHADIEDFLTRALTDHAKKMHGLAPADAAGNAELGEPLQLHVIVPEKVDSCVRNSCRTAADFALPITTYLFPVKFNGEVKLMISVDKYPGRSHYEIGSLGYRWLAGEMVRVFAQWPNAAGNTVKLFVSQQAQVYAFWVPEKGEDNFTLIDPLDRNQFRYTALTVINDVLPSVNQRIARALGQGENQ